MIQSTHYIKKRIPIGMRFFASVDASAVGPYETAKFKFTAAKIIFAGAHGINVGTNQKLIDTFQTFLFILRLPFTIFVADYQENR